MDAPQGEWGIFSYAFYERVKDSVPQFDQIAAFQAEPHILSVRNKGSNSQARAFLGEYVSGNYFETFGLKPFAGRLFNDADDRRNALPVAVMSYRTWQQEFGGNLSIVGSDFVIEGFPFTIVGIAPPGFFGETLSSTPPSMWIPLQTEFMLDDKAAFNSVPASAWLRLIGHLRPGATTAGVSSQLTAMLQHWIPAESAMMRDYTTELMEELPKQHINIASAPSGVGAMKDAYGSSLGILFGICASVLLIACANVANLLLARGMSRHAQVAIRIALGASRRRLILQSLTESTLLAVLGGAAGVGVAWLGTRLAVLLAFGRHTTAMDVGFSWPVLGFCFVLALLSGILCGTIPAWLSVQADPVEAMRGVNRSTSDSSAHPRKALVILQTALSLALIAGASMLTHRLLDLERQDFGFSTENRLTLTMEEPLAAYSLDHLNVLYRTLLYRLVQIPGVRSASLALYDPFTGPWKEPVVKPGEGMPRADGSQAAICDRVSPGYFQTIGQPVIQGRDITEADNATAHNIAIVNQAFVHRFYPKENPIGQYFGFGAPANSKSFEIVGVVRDAKYADPDQPAAPLAQRINCAQPGLQDDEKWSHFITGPQFLIAGDMGRIDPLIRDAFKEVDPNFAIVSIQPMQQQIAVNFDQKRAVAQWSGLFGTLALLLASIGLYGITAFTVARRTSEIGIRMAVGANRLHIVLLILRETFILVALGLVLGVPGAILMGKLLVSRLYKVGALDPIPLCAATAALLLCAFVASIIPARRAASIEPLEALRTD